MQDNAGPIAASPGATNLPMESPPVDWSAVRRRFPAVADCTYLNTASRGLLCDSGHAAGVRYYQRMYDDAAVGLSSHWSDELEAARTCVAQFIGATAADLAFVPNASTGLNLLADMLGEPGEVIAHQDEFPSVTLPWLQRGYPVNFLVPDASGTVGLDAIEAAIGNTAVAGRKFLLLSTVQYASGFAVDLRAVRDQCDQHDALLICDATQAVGVLPTDVSQFRPDGLVFSGYKWTCSGYGIGGLYVARKHLDSRPLPAAGWRSNDQPYDLVNNRKATAKKALALELGNPVMPGPLVLAASLALISSIGIEAVARRVAGLSGRLRAGLQAQGFVLRSPADPKRCAGITLFEHMHPELLEGTLSERRVHVSARQGGVRVSPHFYNDEADVDRLLEALTA